MIRELTLRDYHPLLSKLSGLFNSSFSSSQSMAILIKGAALTNSISVRGCCCWPISITSSKEMSTFWFEWGAFGRRSSSRPASNIGTLEVAVQKRREEIAYGNKSGLNNSQCCVAWENLSPFDIERPVQGMWYDTIRDMIPSSPSCRSICHNIKDIQQNERRSFVTI